MQKMEMIEHLYFKCLFSAYLWKLCTLKLGISDITGKLVENAEIFGKKNIR